ADDVLDRDLEDVAGGEDVGTVGERREPDLRALQVGEDRDGASRLLGRAAHIREVVVVDGVVAVAQIESRDIESRVDQIPDGLLGRGRRPEGRDDLGSSHRNAFRTAGHACPWVWSCARPTSAAPHVPGGSDRARALPSAYA